MNNQMYQPYQQQRNGIIWVQGIEGAKAYQLMPNTNAVLLDSENDGKFYIKIADNVGMCTLRIFKYEEITDTNPQYGNREELTAILQEMLRENNEQSISTAKRNNKSKSVITE